MTRFTPPISARSLVDFSRLKSAADPPNRDLAARCRGSPLPTPPAPHVEHGPTEPPPPLYSARSRGRARLADRHSFSHLPWISLSCSPPPLFRLIVSSFF